MGLHKLTAGDGYTYLTRQVAAHDSTEQGVAGLGDYYAQRGESPGRWFGAGLAGLDMPLGDVVTATQMEALFGAGRHPNAQVIAETVLAAGGSAAEAKCPRVHSKITVLRRLSQRNVRLAGVEIDGLSSDDNDRVAVLSRGDQRIKQR